MTKSIEYQKRLKSLITANDMEQLLDDPASLGAPTGDIETPSKPQEPMRMGAGPMTGTAHLSEETPPALSLENTLRKFESDEELTFDEVMQVEAIIIPLKRPAVLVQSDDYRVEHAQWLHLNQEGSDARSNILSALPSVGRINLPSNSAVPYAGTGFIVSETLLMTNRHVAEQFTNGLGEDNVTLKPGASVNIDFKAEHLSLEPLRLQIIGVRMVHPFWDMALLEVEGIPKNAVPFQLSQATATELRQKEIAVIGYPAFDPRNDRELQRNLFNSIFNVKRMQPGLYTEQLNVMSYDNKVRAIGHDASTLGGNSGSAVIDLETGLVVGLHFAGIPEKSNFAVPTYELARDPFVTRAGIEFSGSKPTPFINPWAAQWAKTRPTEIQENEPATALHPPQHSGGLQVTAHTNDGNRAELSIQVPLKLSVGFDLPQNQSRDQTVDTPTTEKAVEPFHDPDYDDRAGYDPDFLDLHVPMPQATNSVDLSTLDDGSTELKYHNFSIVQNAHRRLAQITAANVDASEAAKEPEPAFLYTRKSLNGFTDKNDREKWFLDPRIPSSHQLPDRFYNADRTAFDKGHLVRREAVAFGDSFQDVQFANGDSFHSTNCSPQVKGFNRSSLGGIWGKLENDVLESAESERCIVFSGPIFDDMDREFHGRDLEGATVVQIPSRYWKMIVTREGDKLNSFAYTLEQDLSDVDFEFAKAGDWTHHEIDPKDLERLLGNVTFPHLLVTSSKKMSANEWSEFVQDPETTDEEILEVSTILPGVGAFDFRIAPDPEFVDLPAGAAETENAMAVANDLSRSRRKTKFEWNLKFNKKRKVLVSEMDSWGQFPVLVRETVDHLNKTYNVYSVGAAGDTAQNMVLGPKKPRGTEYMLALDAQRARVEGFVFSAAGNDIIGLEPGTDKPVLSDLLRQFNGNPNDISGHINHALLAQKLDFLRGVYKTVISNIRADADFKKLPIFIHGYDYPFPYPWVNDKRSPSHAAKDKWLGKPFADKDIHDRNLRRGILKVFIDQLYDMLSEFSKNPKTTKVWLVDCRGAMPDVTDWIDEIHGTSAGFRKVTERFKDCLKDAGI